jgi:hypothetical protein
MYAEWRVVFVAGLPNVSQVVLVASLMVEENIEIGSGFLE